MPNALPRHRLSGQREAIGNPTTDSAVGVLLVADRLVATLGGCR